MTSIIILCVLMVVFIALSLPIGMALGLSTMLTILQSGSGSLTSIVQYVFNGLNSFSLLAIPFFVLAGNLMALGGISRRIVNFFDRLVGRVTGGMGVVATLGCMFFAAISGSGPATVSAIGGMMYPEMVKRNYDGPYSAALTACAGTIGVIIPPSIPFVIYGVAVNASIGDLFIAGIIPGILIGVALIIVNYFVSKKHGYKGSDMKNGESLFKVFKEAFFALMSPVIILGGIYTGMFTPTEAAVVSIVYSLVVGKFVYKELTMKVIIDSIRNTAEQMGMIGLAMGLSAAFSAYLATEQVPVKLSQLITSAISSEVLLMLAILAILLIVGCFIDNISACLILAPVFVPIASAIGYDSVHFGIIMTVALAIGFVTPPFGVNLFVASGMSGQPIETISKKVWGLVISMVIVLLLVTFIEPISMGLVRLA